MQLQRYMMIRHLDGGGVKFVVISTWSYENRVRKHFVIFLNLSNSLFTVFFAYAVFFWLVP